MTVMRKLKARSLVALGLLLAILATSFPLTAMAGDPTLNAVEITPDDRAYDWVTAGKKTYTYDFTSTEITDYSTDEVLATASLRTNMIFDGQTLSCKEGKTFSFGSSLFLGDDYGLYGGELSLDAAITDGKLSVGVRLSRTATDAKHRGIWFTFDGTDTVTVSEPESRLTATVKADKAASVGKLTVKDKARSLSCTWTGLSSAQSPMTATRAVWPFWMPRAPSWPPRTRPTSAPRATSRSTPTRPWVTSTT